MSQQINLFNPIFLKQKKIFTVVPMAEALGVILLGALALVFYGKHQVAAYDKMDAALKVELASRETRLNRVATDFAPRKKTPELVAELDQVEAKLKSLQDVQAILQRGELGNTQGYAEYFRALARQHISGLWLTGVSITGAGSAIGVQGRAMQATLIPDYIARLTAENVMRGKTFASLAIERPVSTVQAQPAAAEAPAAEAPLTPYVEFNLQSAAASVADAGKAVLK